MKLLHDHNYNYDVAKFHILFPSVVLSSAQRGEDIIQSLTEKELEIIVSGAIIDLRGCKSKEAEEAITSIKRAV